MKEFIEKLIGRLEEMIKPKQLYFCKYARGGCKHLDDDEKDCMECVVEIAISIVNELAEEYKGGWIPCSSGNFSTSEVLVCKEDGTIDFDVFDFMDEDWKFNSNHHKNKVLAWMPLPAPYKENENDKI